MLVTEKKENHRSRQTGLDAIATLTKVIDDYDQLEENYETILTIIQGALAADRIALLLADTEGVFRFQSSLGLSAQYQSAVEIGRAHV